MSDLLSGPVGGALVGAGVTALAGLSYLRLNRQHAEADDQRVLRRESAQALLAGLGPVREIVVHHAEPNAAVPLASRRVAEVLKSWGRIWEEQEHRLPDNARHMRRSLRMALGEDLGLSATTDIDDIGVGYQLADPDPVWCENALNYLDHVRDWLKNWHDNPGPTNKNPPLRFDDWLQFRARREYDVRHGLITASDRMLHRFSGPHEERP